MRVVCVCVCVHVHVCVHVCTRVKFPIIDTMGNSCTHVFIQLKRLRVTKVAVEDPIAVKMIDLPMIPSHDSMEQTSKSALPVYTSATPQCCHSTTSTPPTHIHSYYNCTSPLPLHVSPLQSPTTIRLCGNLGGAPHAHGTAQQTTGHTMW